MADAVKWGILSTADINRKLIPGAHASPKVELLAVASRDKARAESFAREWNIERAYGSYEELFADPEVEAVYIPLPNTLHREWTIKAVDAGKHVLCEKPFSRHSEDVEAAFDARRAQRPAGVGGFHVPPQPSDCSPDGARHGGRNRRDSGSSGPRSATPCTTRRTSVCARMSTAAR